MIYTIIVDGQSYDLPKKTIGVMQSLEDILKVDSLKISVTQKYTRIYDFIKKLVGSEVTDEMFGTSNIDEMDMSDLTLTLKKIKDAYDKPIQDYENDKTRQSLDSLPVDKVVELAKAVQNLPQTK